MVMRLPRARGTTRVLGGGAPGNSYSFSAIGCLAQQLHRFKPSACGMACVWACGSKVAASHPGLGPLQPSKSAGPLRGITRVRSGSALMSCMCVCMCAHMHIYCTNIHLHPHTHTNIHTYIHTYIHTHKCIHAQIPHTQTHINITYTQYTNTLICIQTYKHPRIEGRTCMWTYIRICMQTYLHIIYICIYMQMCVC